MGRKVAMTTSSTPSPPRVLIPEQVWSSGSLAPFMAQLAVEHGPIFSFVPEEGNLAGTPAVYLVGPEANRFVLLSGRTHFTISDRPFAQLGGIIQSLPQGIPTRVQSR
jgi:hypothetical protein